MKLGQQARESPQKRSLFQRNCKHLYLHFITGTAVVWQYPDEERKLHQLETCSASKRVSVEGFAWQSRSLSGTVTTLLQLSLSH